MDRGGWVSTPLGMGHSVTIRIEDADGHGSRTRDHGARITQEPVTNPRVSGEVVRATMLVPATMHEAVA